MTEICIILVRKSKGDRLVYRGADGRISYNSSCQPHTMRVLKMTRCTNLMQQLWFIIIS